MVEIRKFQELIEIVGNIDIGFYQRKICSNMKAMRLEHYEAYKISNNGAVCFDNPYSTECISTLLGISKVHYKRLENESDNNKNINIQNLIRLKHIYNCKYEDFLK